MNEKYTDITYVFHSTREYLDLIQSFINESSLSNCEIVSDDKIKNHILQKSVFAVAKSGTVSLEISNAKIPSIILYKMGFINFMIVKSLIKTKYANIINFAANEEVIPELLQSNCNSKNIYNKIDTFFENNSSLKNQINKTHEIIKTFRTNKSAKIAASILNDSF